MDFVALDNAAIRASTVPDLAFSLRKLKNEQFNLRFQKATGQLENYSRIKKVRRSIARIETEITDRRAVAPRAVAHELRAGFNTAANEKNNLSVNHRRAEPVYDAAKVVDQILEKTLSMMDEGTFDPARIVARLSIELDALGEEAKLSQQYLTPAIIRTARRATSLLIPTLYARPQSEIAAVLKLLSVTSWFETEIVADERRDMAERVSALLKLYKVPCLISAALFGARRPYWLELASTTDLGAFLGAPGEVQFDGGPERTLDLVVFVAARGEAAKKLQSFRLNSRETDWREEVQIPDDVAKVYVSVDGETTLVKRAA